MTRQDFIDYVGYWSELLDFCTEEGCYVCENIYSDASRNDFIEEDLYEMVRDMNWREVLNVLQGYDSNSGYDYYLKNDYGEFEGLNDDDDFVSYKDDVLDWGDRYSVWEDEEDDEEDNEENLEPYDSDDEVPLEAEDISFEELFAPSVSVSKNSNAENNDLKTLLAV